MDFAAVGRFTVSREPSGRQCPDCAIPLQAIRIDTGAGFFAIERCDHCYGLFFDVDEVPAFLEASVSPAFSVNFRELTAINEDRGLIRRPVRYIKCPECGVIMNRVNYGSKSGVVVDQCKEHGIWLDNGELVHLMEWKKAGGQLLDQQKAVQHEQCTYHRPVPSYPVSGYPEPRPEEDLLSTACSVLFDRLFR
jgi:Zn-finger nucleic acid-binding protein